MHTFSRAGAQQTRFHCLMFMYLYAPTYVDIVMSVLLGMDSLLLPIPGRLLRMRGSTVYLFLVFPELGLGESSGV